MPPEVSYLEFTKEMSEGQLWEFEEWLIDNGHTDLIQTPFLELWLTRWQELYQRFLKGKMTEENVLAEFPTEQLETELERRERLAEKPEQLSRIDVSHLQAACQEYIDYMAEHGREIKDGSHYIYEAAMETFFGIDVWYFVNAHVR